MTVTQIELERTGFSKEKNVLLKAGSSIFEKYAVVSEEENEGIKSVGSQAGLSSRNT